MRGQAASRHAIRRHLTAVAVATAAVIAVGPVSAASARQGRPHWAPPAGSPTAVVSQGPIYNVPPPRKLIGKTLLKTAGETLQGIGNMVAGVGVAGLVANGLASLGIVDLPVTVPGAAISGAIAGVGVTMSFVGGFIKNYFSDPIDFRFTRIARPASPHLPTLGPAAPALSAVTAAEHELLVAMVRSYALSKAFVTSVDRAHGALVRHNSFWKRRQLNTALAYAREGAVQLSRLPGLQRKLQTDFEQLGVKIEISPRRIASNEHRLAGGLPSQFGALLKRLGLGRYKGMIERRLRSAKPPGYGLDFPAILTASSLVSQERGAARTLASYRTSTILKIIRAGGAH